MELLKKKWRMLSGQVSSMSLVTNNNIIMLCEQSPTSWCQYQRDKFNKTNLFKHGPGLSKEVIALVKPVYKDLIKLEELEKCRHGITQNQNESFNALIWERAPKSVYLSMEKMRLAVYTIVFIYIHIELNQYFDHYGVVLTTSTIFDICFNIKSLARVIFS